MNCTKPGPDPAAAAGRTPAAAKLVSATPHPAPAPATAGIDAHGAPALAAAQPSRLLPRPRADQRRTGLAWLGCAMAAVAVLAVAAAVVSWDAQYVMVARARHTPAIAALEAGIPDAGAGGGDYTRAKTELIQELTDRVGRARAPAGAGVRGVGGEGKVSSAGEVSGADAKVHYVR